MENKQINIISGTIFISCTIISASIFFLGAQIGQLQTSSMLTMKNSAQEEINDKIVQAKETDTSESKIITTQQTKKVNENLADDDDAFLGDKNAPVTMVEFSDYQCPYCRIFFNETYPQITEKYINTGKVKFVYRDFPFNFHNDAMPAAIAAECVRDQKGDKAYFAFHDKIFEGQNKLGTGTVRIPVEDLKNYAKELDVNINEFNSCLENEKFKNEIENDIIDGKKAGIDGTPGFVINGETVIGAQPFEKFEAVIEAALSNNN